MLPYQGAHLRCCAQFAGIGVHEQNNSLSRRLGLCQFSSEHLDLSVPKIKALGAFDIQ